MDFLCFFSRNGNWSHLVARCWASGILWASRIEVQVLGLDRIDPAKPYIYMPNHLSNFDIPVILSRLPVQFRWLAKAELFKIPIFGLSMKRVGYISIDRSDRDAAIESLRAAADKIRSGVSVVIFPEGTRSRDGHLKSFKKGGFVMAIDAAVPIVPVAISGTWEIMAKVGWRIRPGKVTVNILEPIPSTGYQHHEKKILMRKVRQALAGSV